VRDGGGVLARSVVQVLAFVIPMVFTVRYAAAVRARLRGVTERPNAKQSLTRKAATYSCPP
jgi:hypothetical protein